MFSFVHSVLGTHGATRSFLALTYPGAQLQPGLHVGEHFGIEAWPQYSGHSVPHSTHMALGSKQVHLGGSGKIDTAETLQHL